MDDRARRHATELMAALADGDRRAFAPLFAVLSPALRAFCRRTLASDADGDDAAQDALVSVFQRATEFDRERDALSWALGIAAWQCRTVRRRQRRRREVELPPEPLGGATPAIEARLLEQAAIEVLGQLRPADVRTILAAVEDDVALRAGVAPATFRKRLERAVERLRLAWRSRHGTL
jgi:RNA polymerase sigma-70 factor (ECF subfamily)